MRRARELSPHAILALSHLHNKAFEWVRKELKFLVSLPNCVLKKNSPWQILAIKLLNLSSPVAALLMTNMTKGHGRSFPTQEVADRLGKVTVTATEQILIFVTSTQNNNYSCLKGHRNLLTWVGLSAICQTRSANWVV